MRKKRNVLYLMMLVMLALGLVFTPAEVNASGVTTDTGEESEQTEQAISPITPTSSVIAESVEASEGWTAEPPSIVGLTIEQDDIDEEDEEKATWTLRAKLTGIPTIATYVYLMIGEEEPDGNVYYKTEAYLSSSEIRDAVNGTLKIAKKVEVSNGWKPSVGQELTVAVMCEGKSYPSGEYKFTTSGYKKTYKVTAGKKRLEKKRKAKLRRLKVSYKNHNNRLIAFSKTFYYEEGAAYTIPALKINGYSMSSASQSALTGTMGAEDATVDIAYEGDTVPVKVSFVSGEKEVATAYNENKKVGDAYSVPVPKVEGYVLSSDAANTYDSIKGIVPAGGVDRKVNYYEKKCRLVINHLNENGKELYPQADSYQLKPGESYEISEAIRTFDGYTLADDENNNSLIQEVQKKDSDGNIVTDDGGNPIMIKVIKGTMPDEDKEMTLNYTLNKAYVKVNITYQGVDESVAAPEGLPATFTKTLNALEDYTYEPKKIEGWTIVSKIGYSEYYDSKNNVLTVPGNSMVYSTEEKPYEYGFCYVQNVDATLNYKWDDSQKAGVPAKADTYTVTAGSKKTVNTPIVEADGEGVDGYISSRGTSTTIVANEWNQDVDGAVYYTPFTWENGRKVVEGTPGDVIYTANWDPVNPDAPYTIDVTANYSAAMDNDAKCTFNNYGEQFQEVYIGGDATTGELVATREMVWQEETGNMSFTIDTASKYYKENHDKFMYTIYEERALTGATVFVKTTYTVDLPATPVESLATATTDNLFNAVDISEAKATLIDGSNHAFTSSGYRDSGYKYAFPVTEEQDTAYKQVKFEYSLTDEQVKGLGINSNYSSSGKSACVLKGTYNNKTVDLGASAQWATIDDDKLARTITLTANLPSDALGNIGLESWVMVGNGWVHATATTVRNNWPDVSGTTVNEAIVADNFEYNGFIKGKGDVGAVTGDGDQYVITWKDDNNVYCEYTDDDANGTPNVYKEAGYAYNNVYAMNTARASISGIGYSGNTVYAGTTPVGIVTNLETVPENDEHHTSYKATYKATVLIYKDMCKDISGKEINFTLWNQGIGINDADATSQCGYTVYELTTDANGNNTMFYHSGHSGDSNSKYYYDGGKEVSYTEVVKNMKTTIKATLSEDALKGGYTDAVATIDTANSTLSSEGKLNLQWTVDDTLKNALEADDLDMSYAVYAVNCDEETEDNPINPVLKRYVDGQSYCVYGWNEYGSTYNGKPTIDGNTLTWDASLVVNDYSSGNTTKYIKGGKYKIALVMKGLSVKNGATDTDPKTGNYYTATAYATLTAGEKPAFVDVSDFEITKATVAKTYEKDGNKYPELNIEWDATVTGVAEADADNKLSFYINQNYPETYSRKNIDVTVSIYDVDKGKNPDQFGLTQNYPDQRSHELTLAGGKYRTIFEYGGTGKPTEILSRNYVASVTYSWETFDKYGNPISKSKTVTKDIKVVASTITDENVLFQVDNAGSALVRVTGDKKLNTPTAIIWNDGKKYDEVTLEQESSSGDTAVKNWYAWLDLSDGHGKAIDTTKLTATLSGTDYDANSFDETKAYPAVAKDFVVINKAKESKDSFSVSYKMAMPNDSFRPVSTYWNIEGESDVESDAGAVVISDDQKIDIYSSTTRYEAKVSKDRETGLYLGKFKSLNGKKLNVKVYDHNKKVVFTTSATIGAEGTTTPTTDVVITKAEYEINGNVKLEGTFNIEAVEKSSWRNTLNISTEGVDGMEGGAKFRMEASDGLTIDFEKGTFTCEGSAFTPSGNDIFGYTLRQFAGLSADAKKLKVSAALNDVESSEATFTYTGGALKTTDSMIKEGKEDDAGYLVVSLPRGYFTNAVDIGGVIATAIEGGKGLKFVSEEDDIEFSFDAATVATMTGEGDALLAVSKYTGEMPENVKKSGLNATTAYEIGLSRKYTGKAKVRFISEATLTEGATPGVFFVDADGKTEEMATTYSINQYEEVEAYSDLTHCSTFAVVYKGQQSPNANVTVTFDANGGTGAMDPQVVKKGTATQLNANAFARDGFTFAGWATKKDATAAEYADKASVTFNADATLYAVWKANAGGGNEQGGQSGQSGDNGQTTTAPVTTIQDEISGGEYTVTTNAAGEQTAEFKTPLVKHTIIIIPAIVVVNGNECKVTSIADNAFKNDNSITSLTIGENVEIIGESAFEGCAKITTVVIPVSVKTIEKSAFEDCTSLKKIVIPSSVTTVGEKAFEGCNKLTTATISKGVTEIGTQAFANCTSLTKIVVPATVKKIGAQAFAGDKKLTNATVGANVEEIGTKAFANCPKIKSITIPKKVKKLGDQIFTGDKSLKNITIKSTNLTAKNVSSKAFKGVNNKVTIKVPKSKKKAYTKLFRKKGLSKKVKIK